MGSKGATTTQTSAPPKEVVEMYKYLTEQGKVLQQQPYQPYTGQMVADLNPMQQQGLQQVGQYAQTAQPYYQGAAAGTLGAMQGYTPQGFQQGVGGYMSPYLQNAMGSTAALLGSQQAQQRQELLGKTIASGAFGGDRGKIAQAALAGQQNLASGEILGKMAQQGYSDAATNYLKSIGAQGALAQQLGDLGTAAQAAGLQGAQAVSQAGGTPYQIEQAKLASQYGQFAQGQAYPFQTLGYLANIASGLGAGQGGTSSTTSPGPNVLGQAIGTALSLATLPYSDERLKDDIKEVGETFDGQPIYSFKYKGDDTTHMGLMAQDVEKKHPEAVGLAGGYKTVDYDKATEDAAERGKFYLGGASMGGLVPAGMDRQAYATKGTVSITPYEDDPLSQLMSEYQKIAFAKYVPELSIRGGGVGIPDAPRPYEDKASDITSGLQAMPKKQRAALASNLKKMAGLGVSAYDPYYTFGAGGYEGMGPFTSGYADGGLVPRTAHADGEAVPEPTSGAPVSFIEKTFNKGNPYSDEARAGLLAAGLGMLASRSPFVGTAVGEGGLAGLNTYYNALKNKYEIQKGLAELEVKGRGVEVQEAGIPIDYERIKLEREKMGQERLRQFLENYEPALGRSLGVDANGIEQFERQMRSKIGGPTLTMEQYQAALAKLVSFLPPEQAAAYLGRIPARQAQAIGGESLLPKDGGIQPVISPEEPKRTDDQIIQSAISSAIERPQTSVPLVPKEEVAAEPKIKLAQAQPTQPTMTDATQVDMQTEYPDIAPKGQPNYFFKEAQIYKNRADAYAQMGRYKDVEEQMKLYEQMMKRGQAIARGEEPTMLKDGIVGFPRSIVERMRVKVAEDLASGEKTKSNVQFFNEVGESMAKTMPKAMNDLESLRTVLQNYKSGSFAKLDRDVLAAAEALGWKGGQIDQNNAVNFDKFMKTSVASVFNEVKEIGGRVLVSEIEGLTRTVAEPSNQPEANRLILAKQIAALKYINDYYKAAITERDRVGISKFDQASFAKDFARENNFDGYVEEAYKNTPTRGALPSPKNMKEGALYVVEMTPDGRQTSPYVVRYMGMDPQTNKPQFQRVGD